MVVPTTTEGPAVNTLVPFVEAVEEAGEGALQGPDYYGAVVEPAAQLREQLAREGIPTFGGQVRRRQDFDTAALQDRLVYQLPDRRARDGWHDYEAVGPRQSRRSWTPRAGRLGTRRAWARGGGRADNPLAGVLRRSLRGAPKICGRSSRSEGRRRRRGGARTSPSRNGHRHSCRPASLMSKEV